MMAFVTFKPFEQAPFQAGSSFKQKMAFLNVTTQLDRIQILIIILKIKILKIDSTGNVDFSKAFKNDENEKGISKIKKITSTIQKSRPRFNYARNR